VFWVAVGVVAVALFVAYRHAWWFVFDDLTIVGSRLEVYERHGLMDLLFRRHNEHLMAGMVAWDVGLAKVFGMLSYTPWMATIVAALIGVAVVLRATMQAVGLPRLFAAIAAPLLLVWASFGNVMFWAPETIFAVISGLFMAQLLLVEHDGSVGRRDLLGAAFACVAVLVHSAAVVGAVGVVVLLLARRRRRAAAVAAVPLSGYLVWLVTYGRRPAVYRPLPVPADQPTPRLHDPLTMVSFVVRAVGSMIHHRWAPLWAVVVVGLLVCGLRALRGSGRPFRIAVTLTAVAAVELLTLAWTRSVLLHSPAPRIPGRYIAVVGLPLIPVLFVGAVTLARHPWRWAPRVGRAAMATVVVAALLAVSVQTRRADLQAAQRFAFGTRSTLIALAGAPDLDRLDPQERVFAGVAFVDIVNGDVVRLRNLGWLDG
jgi:hypothetical protein